MPTYEYVCKCGAEFEEFQSITSEPVAKCPQCGRKAKRVVSAGAGLIFKGSGFYITDYKKNGNGANGKAEKGEQSEGSSAAKETSDKKTDSPSGSDATSSKTPSESNAKPSPKPAKT